MKQRVAFLWAGEWDEYDVDTATVRDMTPDELLKSNEGNCHYQPEVAGSNGEWLRCLFTKDVRIGRAGQCVRILNHLGRGD
jgi:hypothetical protein